MKSKKQTKQPLSAFSIEELRQEIERREEEELAPPNLLDEDLRDDKNFGHIVMNVEAIFEDFNSEEEDIRDVLDEVKEDIYEQFIEVIYNKKQFNQWVHKVSQ